MIAKRVIPCLDVHGGQVTRGVRFGIAEAGGLRNVGDPVELALRYNEQGADEMMFFDITATAHGLSTMVEVVERAADQCFMPLTVGGGLRSVEDMYTMLRAGADKISINSSALATPDLIRAGAEKFGSQCIVVSIDARKVAPDRWEVFSHGSRKATGWEAVEWAKRAVSLGAGEIVLNSIDADGTKEGFDLVITRRISEAVGVPFVSQALADVLASDKTIREVVAIGPLPMMKACCETTRPFAVPTIVSLNSIMEVGTGMCGSCRVTVGGKMKFACVDGADFDGHLVNFDELNLRQKRLQREEKAAL